jgi:hypothetical protein
MQRGWALTVGTETLLKSNSLLTLESTYEDGFSVCETTPLIDQALLDVVAHYLPGSPAGTRPTPASQLFERAQKIVPCVFSSGTRAAAQ